MRRSDSATQECGGTELRIAYSLTRPNGTWNGATGRIDVTSSAGT